MLPADLKYNLCEEEVGTAYVYIIHTPFVGTSHFEMQISFLSHFVWLLVSLISYIHYWGEGRELSMSLVLSSLPYEKCMHFARFSCPEFVLNSLRVKFILICTL